MDRTAKDVNATAVAHIIGCGDHASFDALPVGFRHNWNSIEDAGGFERCRTFGEMAKAYLAHVAATIAPNPAPAAGCYSRPIELPKSKRDGLLNFLQMIINAAEAGDSREALLKTVDLRQDIESGIYDEALQASGAR